MSRYSRSGGYGRYRGRRSTGARAVLKWIIVFLAALLVAAAALLFFLQDHLVYGDNGVHFVPPWGSGEPVQSPAPTPSGGDELPVLITDPPVQDTPAPADGAPSPLHAVEVSQTALLAGTAADQAAATGGNAVVVAMKNDDGTLNYVSAVPLAVSAGASGADPDANAAIRDLTAGGLYTIAKVSCFRDHTLPGYDAELALHTNSGYRWVDYEEVRWTGPANETVRDYLTDLCVELAGLGFDEILLTNCGYPMERSGTLGYIKVGEAYPKGALDTVLTPFLAQVRAALEPYGAKLSVQAAGSELAGETADTGLTLASVAASCDRFWVDAGEAEGYADFAGAPEDPSEQLVRVGTAAGAADDAWAILS